MIREFYESSEDDDMESQYQADPEGLVLSRPDKDMHNKCCGGKAWCIKVTILRLRLRHIRKRQQPRYYDSVFQR